MYNLHWMELHIRGRLYLRLQQRREIKLDSTNKMGILSQDGLVETYGRTLEGRLVNVMRPPAFSNWLLLLYFIFNWSIVGIKYYMSFKCTTQLFNICVPYEVITKINLVSIRYQTMYSRCYWLYSLCFPLHLRDLFNFICGI